MKQYLIDFYLEFLNDFITVSSFADYHEISNDDAIALLEVGKKWHEEKVLTIVKKTK